MLDGLNHITLAVRDLQQSFSFYADLLGMNPKAKWKNGAYLTAGELWFCLSCDDSIPSKDYSHIAFNISAENFARLKSKLINANVDVWKLNKSEGKSFYISAPLESLRHKSRCMKFMR